MMRRWHHGHSIGAGVVGGLLVSRRPELVFVAGFASAFLVLGGIRLYRTLLSAFEAWRAGSRAKRETIETKPVPRYPGDSVPF